jgi:hypothetical protein
VAVASLPTLDQLAAQPELAANLTRDAACRLYLQAQGVMLACALAVLGEPKDAAQSDGHEQHDQLIDARETARILSRSVSWVQQGSKRAPLKFCSVRTMGRTLLFSRKKIDALIAREVGQNPEDKTLGLRGVNSGRRPQRKGTAGPPSPDSGGESREGEHRP